MRWLVVRKRMPAIAGLMLLAVLTGCQMCMSPFDYCSSVLGPDGCPEHCDFCARVNSIFAPPGGAAGEEGYYAAGPTPAESPSQPPSAPTPATPSYAPRGSMTR